MTPVHDHLAWVLVGIYKGNQDEEFYLPQRGRLGLVRRRPLAPGDFYTLLPPRDDIHRVRTTSAETSVSVPAIVASGEGLSVENPVGGVMTFKTTSRETGGALTALETIAAPGEGPPLHVHAEDELIYTLEGTFRVRLGDAIQQAEPGSFVFIPRGTPHTWQNVSDRPARFFPTIMPASTAFETRSQPPKPRWTKSHSDCSTGTPIPG